VGIGPFLPVFEAVVGGGRWAAKKDFGSAILRRAMFLAGREGPVDGGEVVF